MNFYSLLKQQKMSKLCVKKEKKEKKQKSSFFFSKDKIKPRIIEILHVFYAYNNPYISKT